MERNNLKKEIEFFVSTIGGSALGYGLDYAFGGDGVTGAMVGGSVGGASSLFRGYISRASEYLTRIVNREYGSESISCPSSGGKNLLREIDDSSHKREIIGENNKI